MAIHLINIILALWYVWFGVFLIAICLPLRDSAVKMNRWYGIRFKKSFESEDNWYKINRYGALKLIFWAKVIIGAGVLILLTPLDGNRILIIFGSILPLLLLVPPIFETLRYANKL